MKITANRLYASIVDHYNIDPNHVFDQRITPLSKRFNIINHAFQQLSGYELTQKGLVNLNNRHDRFPNYTTRYVHSFESLLFDLNRVSQIRKRPINRIKMQWKKTQAKWKARKLKKQLQKRALHRYRELWSREERKRTHLHSKNKNRDRTMDHERCS